MAACQTCWPYVELEFLQKEQLKSALLKPIYVPGLALLPYGDRTPHASSNKGCFHQYLYKSGVKMVIEL